MDRLRIAFSGQHLSVLYADILRLEGDGNYTRFVLANGRKILTSVSLGFYEKVLSKLFIRVHKHCIINRGHVQLFAKKCLTMCDGVEVAIARRKLNRICNISH